jgi:GntR family transcriptional regulator
MRRRRVAVIVPGRPWPESRVHLRPIAMPRPSPTAPAKPTNKLPAPVAPPAFRPLYLQIKDLLVRSLDAREWQPGEAIPSELLLAARYGVSQGTVRKAIDALAGDNLVVRRQGKGTFVATHTEEAHSTFRFLHIRRDDGADEYPASRIVGLRRGKASPEVARLIDLKPGDAVVIISRVLDWEGAPAVLDEITLPAALFRGLTRAKLEAYQGSMYGFFETAFGVRMIAAHERLKAVAADAAAAVLLGVPAGTPLLEVDRVAFTYGGRPVEFRRGLCSTVRHHYFNALG